MAAVLAAGRNAALSHRSAAALWGILPTSRARIEVTVPHTRKPRRGLELHRSPLTPDEVTVEQGVRTTTVPRTLLDLAAVVPAHALERALREAEVRRLADPLSLADLLDRYRGRVGAPALSAAIARVAEASGVIRSELEERFLGLLDRFHLPRPQLNAWLEVDREEYEVDCLWRAARLVVELDGHAAHSTRYRFESDRERDRALAAAGWRVVRITWHGLEQQPERIAADLGAILEHHRTRRRP